MGPLPTLAEPEARALMDAAHRMCPFRRAARGNIRVTLELVPTPSEIPEQR